MNDQPETQIKPFSFFEKLFAYTTFNVGLLVGAYGLYLHSLFLAIAYLLYAYIGIIILMRYTVCPRCPHLLVANDCLNLPAAATKRIISPGRQGSLNLTEKIIFSAVLYGNLVLPIYWLASRPLILVIFLVLYGGFLLGLRLHFCPACHNRECYQCRNRTLA